MCNRIYNFLIDEAIAMINIDVICIRGGPKSPG
jgi:hypothetical protein